MPFYIDTETIKMAHSNLTKMCRNNVNLEGLNSIWWFLMLKSSGISPYSYSQLSKNDSNCATCFNLSRLYGFGEKIPVKGSYINPFLTKWQKQLPREEFDSFYPNRVINNVTGGGTTWRNILVIDRDKRMRFKEMYLEEIKNLVNDEKIDILSMAIWANRFVSFDEKITKNELIDSFIKTYNLGTDEITALFYYGSDCKLIFSNVHHDTLAIRKIFDTELNESSMEMEVNKKEMEYMVMNAEFVKKDSVVPDEDTLYQLLRTYGQIILTGPPGTSKSYHCDLLSKKYNGNVIHVQFHPSYTYQQFVGGYLVKGDKVVYERGVFLDLLIDAGDKECLLIIDEINRANVTQVFGDLIQCLDRDQKVSILVDNKKTEVSIPKNIHIVATMNSTDKTLGGLDYAFKRRFITIYCPSNPRCLIDLCNPGSEVPVAAFLEKVNNNLFSVLKDREYEIGHAIFLESSVKSKTSGKYEWTYDKFKTLFFFKILPIVEEYCSKNPQLISQVLGNTYSNYEDKVFKQNIIEFVK